jgi:hypothetical protein
LESEYQNLGSRKLAPAAPLSLDRVAANIPPVRLQQSISKTRLSPFRAMEELMNYVICGLLAWFAIVVVWNMIEFFGGVEIV